MKGEKYESTPLNSIQGRIQKELFARENLVGRG